MKKLTVLLAAAIAAAVTFGQSSGAKQETLASSRAKITQVIDKPDEMAVVMGSLSSEDQVSYLSEVLTAIAAMPASDADRTEKFVAVVNSALASANKGNALALIAEVYAKVPPYALAAVSESLAAGLMNRSKLPKVATNALYIGIATKVMERVNERVAGEDNSGVRSGFAALMLIRASNSSSPDIVSAMVDALPESVRDVAKTEWIPSALGQGGEKSYEPIMAAVDGELKPAYGVSAGGTGSGTGTGGTGGGQQASGAGQQGDGQQAGAGQQGGGENAGGTGGGQQAGAGQQGGGENAGGTGGGQQAGAGQQPGDVGGGTGTGDNRDVVGGYEDPLVGLRIPTVQGLDSLLADIAGAGTEPGLESNLNNPIVDAGSDPQNTVLPVGTGDAAGANDAGSTVSRAEQEAEEVTPVIPPYQNQTTGSL